MQIVFAFHDRGQEKERKSLFCFCAKKKGKTKMTNKHLKRGYYLNKTSHFTSNVASTKMI